jgi:hypothetical protein
MQTGPTAYRTFQSTKIKIINFWFPSNTDQRCDRPPRGPNAGLWVLTTANAVSRRVDVRRPVVKIIAESLSQHDEKHVDPTPLSVGKG